MSLLTNLEHLLKESKNFFYCRGSLVPGFSLLDWPLPFGGQSDLEAGRNLMDTALAFIFAPSLEPKRFGSADWKISSSPKFAVFG